MLHEALTYTGPGSRIRGTREVWGNYMKPPHLLVVSAENSRDPDPVWPGKRPSGEQCGGGGAIGGEIAP